MLDFESFCPEVDERLASEMVPFDTDRDEVEDSLDGSDRPDRAGDVLQQQESPAGPQDALRFAHGLPIVRDGAKR